MRVKFGSGNGFVTQQLLNNPQVSAIFEQMRCK